MWKIAATGKEKLSITNQEHVQSTSKIINKDARAPACPLQAIPIHKANHLLCSGEEMHSPQWSAVAWLHIVVHGRPERLTGAESDTNVKQTFINVFV